MSAAADLAAAAGDALGGELAPLLDALVSRAGADATRVPVARALATIASSPLNLDVSSIAGRAATELTSALALAARPPRAAALAALAALAARAPLPPKTVAAAVAGAAPLVDASDLGLAAGALQLGGTLLRAAHRSAAATADALLPRALALAASPLLQGPAADALAAFLVDAGAATGADLVPRLLDAGTAAAPRSVAAALAAVAAAGGPARVSATVAALVSDATTTAPATRPRRRLALLCLGALGRRADVSRERGVADALASCLDDPDEGVATDAAAAAGGAAAGAPDALLPFVVDRVAAALGGGGGRHAARAQTARRQGHPRRPHPLSPRRLRRPDCPARRADWPGGGGAAPCQATAPNPSSRCCCPPRATRTTKPAPWRLSAWVRPPPPRPLLSSPP